MVEVEEEEEGEEEKVEGEENVEEERRERGRGRLRRKRMRKRRKRSSRNLKSTVHDAVILHGLDLVPNLSYSYFTSWHAQKLCGIGSSCNKPVMSVGIV